MSPYSVFLYIDGNASWKVTLSGPTPLLRLQPFPQVQCDWTVIAFQCGTTAMHWWNYIQFWCKVSIKFYLFILREMQPWFCFSVWDVVLISQKKCNTTCVVVLCFMFLSRATVFYLALNLLHSVSLIVGQCLHTCPKYVLYVSRCNTDCDMLWLHYVLTMHLTLEFSLSRLSLVILTALEAAY